MINIIRKINSGTIDISSLAKMRKDKKTHKRLNKKIVSLALLLVLQYIQFAGFNSVYAEVIPVQPPPEKMRIEPIYNDEPNRQPPIGYNEYDGYYADLQWDSLKSPSIADESYINLYLKEAAKQYRLPKPDVLKESGIESSRTWTRLKNLNSGTIYTAYARAFYTYDAGNKTGISPESVMSNQVRFMTDIEIEAYPYGVNQIKIIWDDVWDFNKRIGYKLYVSEHRDFSGTQPMYITSEQIGENRPVKVNEAEGKLEYNYTIRDPGRVYYVKIIPDIQDTQLKRSDESNVVAASSYILAKTTKMHSTDDGTIWKLEWSPVVTGLNSSDVKITYYIYRGDTSSGDIPRHIGTVDDTNFFVTLPPKDNGVYFIIRAVVTKNGENYYPGINIESDKVIIKESEVSYKPAAPEFVEEFVDKAGNVVINYNNELEPRSASILWRAPKKADGTIDDDITYNIWLTDDPNLIDNPPEASKVASGFKATSGNYILIGKEIAGYKYKLSGLIPNQVYYLKMEAQRTFVDYIDGKLEIITLTSSSSVKVIVTPAEGPSDQPVVPGRPPLSIKATSDGKYLITANTAVIQLKNKWYEKYDSGRWEYISQEEYSDSDKGINYRTVEYDQGVTINVGIIEYDEGMSLEDLEKMPADAIIGHSVIANDPDENPLLNLDGKKHNVDIKLTGLEPNTTYLIWVRAVRLGAGLISGPSDPILVTTSYEYETVLEKPTVPVFSYSQAGKTYVDLVWDFRLNSNYKYYIKYSATEDINSATGSATIDNRQLARDKLSYYRIDKLEPDTVYYFWIQAESFDEDGNSEKSQWSDSYIIRTLPDTPPDPPKGFGIKNSNDAITKNSITFEWVMEQNLEYILEISRDSLFRDSVRYSAGKVSEFKAEGLISNHRYYARLYAYDPEKKLESNPSNIITCRTLRSLDDYDSNEDIEGVISEDFIKKAPAAKNGIWNIEVTGINSDRLIEYMMTDNVLDYVIDLADPPADTRSVRLKISEKVFCALESLKENIIINAGDRKYEFRPGVLKQEKMQADNNYEIIIGLKDTAHAAGSGAAFIAGVNEFGINLYNGGNTTPVLELNKPLRVQYIYNDPYWYKEGATWGYVYDSSGLKPVKEAVTAVYDYSVGKGVLSFETLRVGSTAVAIETGGKPDDTGNSEDSIDSYVTIDEAVKLMLDVIGYKYTGRYLIEALKAGIISYDDVYNPQELCTKKKAIVMASRVYRLKTKGENLDLSKYFEYLQDNSPITMGEMNSLLKIIKNSILM